VPARLAADQRRGSHRGHERWLSGIAGTTGRLWDGRTRFYAMKVIHQLIDYFHSHGALTKSQLAYLRQQGFWPGNGGNVEENPAAPVGPEPAEAPDAFAEDLAVQARARTAPRRCRSSGLPGAAPAIGNLCRRLAGLTVHWDEPLHGFVRLARGLQPCASWAEAVVVLRGAATGLGQTEGTTLAQVGGQWRVLACDGDARRYPVFDLALRETGTLHAPYPSNIPWPTLVPDGSDGWLLVGFNGRRTGGELPGYGTHGDVVFARSG